MEFLETLASYYSQVPFSEQKERDRRYFYKNEFFAYGDAIVLFGMLRHFKPERVIEIGSGFSSAAMLDTNDLFLSKGTHFTFVEPYPNRLLNLLTAEDRKRNRLLKMPVQNVPLELFQELNAGDVLFIDSSHVGKIGSDVLHLLFAVLPALRPGVVIHFHDIHFPFEYPKDWVIEGRAWNEAYLLRSFLMHNTSYEILYFNSFIASLHGELLRSKMPLCHLNPGAGLWLRKTAGLHYGNETFGSAGAGV